MPLLSRSLCHHLLFQYPSVSRRCLLNTLHAALGRERRDEVCLQLLRQCQCVDRSEMCARRRRLRRRRLLHPSTLRSSVRLPTRETRLLTSVSSALSCHRTRFCIRVDTCVCAMRVLWTLCRIVAHSAPSVGSRSATSSKYSDHEPMTRCHVCAEIHIVSFFEMRMILFSHIYLTNVRLLH